VTIRRVVYKKVELYQSIRNRPGTCGCCSKPSDEVGGVVGFVEYCEACWYKLESGSTGPWPDEVSS
jgi:hypothetical protein